MIKREDKNRIARWSVRPLCCKYVAGIFRRTDVQVAGATDGREWTVSWGLGWAPDSEFEILGAWTHCGSADAVPMPVFAELRQRGVENFGVLAGCGAIGQVAHGTNQLSIAGIRCQQVLPSFKADLGESAQLLPLRPTMRQALASADNLTDDIHRRLASAMARHGAVADGAEALDFVAEFLERAERRLYQQRTIRSILLPGPVAAGAGRRISERAVTMPHVCRFYP